MSKIIEAKAVITAEDRTGAAFDKIGRKFKNLGKGAKVSAEIEKLGKSLQRMTAQGAAVDNLNKRMTTLADARTRFREAQAAVAGAAKAIAATDKPSRALQTNLRKAKAEVTAAAKAFEQQRDAAVEARRAVAEFGPVSAAMLRGQGQLAAAVDKTASAMRRASVDEHRFRETKALALQRRAERVERDAVAAHTAQRRRERASGDMISGMGAFGRRQGSSIDANRRLVDGMGASTRLERAERARKAQEEADAKAQRRADRKEAGTVLGAGGAIAAAHKGKELAEDAITSAGDFDIAVRKQQVFTDISDADQAGLLTQAKKIGQETQFSNIDVVKAQTAAMQGLPAGFAPALKAEVAQGIVENVRNYATLMETDLKDGAETIRSYLQATGKDISTKEKALAESNRATNQMVKMAKLGGMNGEDVSQMVKFAAASTTSGGLSTDTMMTLGALARRGGLRGDEAGVAMRSWASKIVAPTNDGLAALNAAGIRHRDYVRMPDKLSTDALEGQFQLKMGKSFTPEIRSKLDTINADKQLIADRERYTAAVTEAVSPILGKDKKGTVRASDSAKAAKAIGKFHTLSAQSVDAEGLLDAAMSKGMTLPQLNAWLTDKHGGKGSITQRQWDEFKSSREQIKNAGDDPNFAKEKADKVMAGLGGSLENLKGSIENAILQAGTSLAPAIKASADTLGAGTDLFSKMPIGVQAGTTLNAGVGAAAAGSWGTIALLRRMLGLGGGATAVGAALGGTSLGLAEAAGLALYATSQTMPKVAKEQGAKGIDYATGSVMDSPAADILRDDQKAKAGSGFSGLWDRWAPSFLGGGANSKAVPVEIKSMSPGISPGTAGQQAGPSLSGTQTLTPDPRLNASTGGAITAKVESLPPVTGTADVNVKTEVHATVTLNEPMLNAKIEAAAGRAAAKIPLSSGGRAGATSMPGAASTPGAAAAASGP